MDPERLKEILESVGNPVFYNNPDSPVAYPIVCLVFESSDDRHADNAISTKKRLWTAELYMDGRDQGLIEEYERALSDNGVSYRYGESYIAEESTTVAAFTAATFI